MKLIPSSPSVPPTGLVMLAIVSTQIGSAIAKTLFQQLDPAGAVFLRVGFAAVMVFGLWRPRWSATVRQNFKLVMAFGVALAMMNATFYAAIARIPIGIAVALEFLGPLGVSVAHSRRWLDVVWVVLAGIGIVLLTPIGDFVVDPYGIALALLSGVGWALYILLSARTGKALPGLEGLAWAMAIGTVVLAPMGIATSGLTLLRLDLLAIACGVALLSSVITYSLELEALRTMPVRVFGVLMSVEPAVAALAGYVVLGETLEERSMMAIATISLAAAGAARTSSAPTVPS